MEKGGVKCPRCGTGEVVKRGLNAQKKQRYLCKNSRCEKKSFLKAYSQKGYEEGVRRQVVAMAMNGSGVRETGRVLGISYNTVTAILKKKRKGYRPLINSTWLREHRQVKLILPYLSRR